MQFRFTVAALLASALIACATTRIIEQPSANQDGRVRLLVLHYTDEPFQRSLELLTLPHANPVSAHYLIGRAGENGSRTPPVLRLVDETQRAWHAGPSRWQGREGLNDQSIGIEIVYESHCGRTAGEVASPWIADAQCDYAAYPADQIAALEQLARAILARHPDIDATRVVGHSDIQPENKTDPGPRFPWRELAQHGIGAWPEDADVARYRDYFSTRPPSWALLRSALVAYGLRRWRRASIGHACTRRAKCIPESLPAPASQRRARCVDRGDRAGAAGQVSGCRTRCAAANISATAFAPLDCELKRPWPPGGLRLQRLSCVAYSV